MNIANIILALAPTIVDLVKSAHAIANPNAPAPSSEDIIAAFDRLFADDMAKDELLKAALRAEIASGKKPVE